MNKTRLVELISLKTGVSKKEVDLVINLFLESIKESVQSGENVEIRGFGNFFQTLQEERKIKSPIAGKTIDVPAKTKINFKASKVTDVQINKGA